MAEFEIDPDYLESLMVKVRAIGGREPGIAGDDYGSNPSDEDAGNVLEDLPGDLSRAELLAELRGLSLRKRQQLLALMWLGRGDGEPEEWDELLAQAAEHDEGPIEEVLLDEPLLADYWAEGLEKLGLGDEAEEIDEL